ncbi:MULTISPECIES: hypothetical protein [unclassified Enterococcus]|uniref:hypothetical protein n=1 Tax=unclassified Enterococcus TaxID=2608891 RepID=UPI001A9AF596|nr:hypothetical protein [Enterococcus sp. DIV1271a]MBO1299555.1 hypothetical protein [Enterococcus sp. DIV1271a]
MEEIKRFKQKYFGTKSQVYFKTLFVFLLSIVVVFVHGMAQKSDLDYQEVELFEEHLVQQGTLSVVKKVFNEEENSFRMDLFFEPTSQSVDDLQRKIEADLVTDKNPEEQIKVKVIPVTSRYFVLMAEGIEPDAATVRLDISYYATQEMNQSLRFYVSKEESKMENESILNAEESKLQIDSIQNDIRIQTVIIDESEKNSQIINQDIALRLDQYEQFTEEKRFQVGSVLQETEGKISTIKSTISNLNDQLETEKDLRNEAIERIKLLEKRIEEIQK